MSKYIVLHEVQTIISQSLGEVEVPMPIDSTKFLRFDELQDALEFISNNGGVLLKTVSLEEKKL